jgi:hypothetical protein
MVSPCIYYAHLGKKYVKSKESNHCSKCVKEGYTYCMELKLSFTNIEWRCLVQA